MGERRDRRVSILGPVLLIAVGVLLLLNTLGILEWSVWWSVLRLWPVLLIAAGLELLLGRRSVWGSLLAAALVLAVIGGAIWLSRSDFVASGLNAETIQQPLGDATKAEVYIEPAIGVLRVEALPEAANLVEGTVYLVKSEQITQDLSRQGDTVTYQLKTGGEAWMPFATSWDDRRAWELGLSPGATLRLRTSIGMGEVDLDLTDLALSQLVSSAGLGRTEVTLPAQGGFSVKIDQAIGQVEVVIPEGLAVRVRAGTAMAARQLPDGFQEEGEDVFTSPGYASAANRGDLEVNLPIGLLTVRYSE
jgi:hypothetical protein